MSKEYKEGDIVCWQMLLYPKPVYGVLDSYTTKIKFTEKKYLYTAGGGLYKPIAYWRIKRLHIKTPN